MTSTEYATKLKQAIKLHGYWSDQVFALNNAALDVFGISKATKIHDRVRGELITTTK